MRQLPGGGAPSRAKFSATKIYYECSKFHEVHHFTDDLVDGDMVFVVGSRHALHGFSGCRIGSVFDVDFVPHENR